MRNRSNAGGGRPRRPRGEVVVNAVLTEVLIELSEHGPEGLNIDRVARRAHVNRTTIYRRWPTRELLIRSALGHLLTEFDPLPDTGSLRGDLEAFAQRVTTLIAEPAGQALLRAAMSPRASDSVADFAAHTMDNTASSTASLLRKRAEARDEWTAPIPANQVLFTIVGAIWHRRTLERAPIDPAWLDQLLDLLLHGLTPTHAKQGS